MFMSSDMNSAGTGLGCMFLTIDGIIKKIGVLVDKVYGV